MLSAELAWTIQLVHPIAVGGRFYRAWCLGVAFCLSYSLLFVTLHFVIGTKLVHPYSVLSPPCAVQHCTPPPSRGRWQPCSARWTGFASPPQCRSTLTLAADSLLWYGFACNVQYYISCAWGCFSLISGLLRVALWWGETKPSALSVVPAWVVQHCTPSRGGWQVCSVLCLGVASQLLLVVFVLATLSLLHPAVYCARSPFSTFPSPWYQASHSWGGGGGGRRGWAIPNQCWAHSVPFTTAPLLRAGGRFAVLDVRIPPCLVQLLVTLLQPLECHARILLATCITFYMSSCVWPIR